MTDESRVLDVLCVDRAKSQALVIRDAHMEYYRCVSALDRLIDLGIVERIHGVIYGRGRPAVLYRRRLRTERHI